jgi:DhnA family fructose-bisphosphate aldolase class Ia
LDVPSITLFGNLLHSNVTERQKIRELAQTIAQEAADLGLPVLVLFPGRNENVDDEQDYSDIADFLRLMPNNSQS